MIEDIKSLLVDTRTFLAGVRYSLPRPEESIVERIDAMLSRLDAMKPGEQAQWVRDEANLAEAGSCPKAAALLRSVADTLDLLTEENAELRKAEAARLKLLAHNKQMKRDVTPY